MSYGIYLYHLIALDLTARLGLGLGIPGIIGEGPALWLLLIAYSLVSWAMAEISFRTLEAWFRRFRPNERPPETVAAEKDPRQQMQTGGPTGKQVTR